MEAINFWFMMKIFGAGVATGIIGMYLAFLAWVVLRK